MGAPRPMTQRLFRDDPYLLEFEARVVGRIHHGGADAHLRLQRLDELTLAPLAGVRRDRVTVARLSPMT